MNFTVNNLKINHLNFICVKGLMMFVLHLINPLVLFCVNCQTITPYVLFCSNNCDAFHSCVLLLTTDKVLKSQMNKYFELHEVGHLISFFFFSAILFCTESDYIISDNEDNIMQCIQLLYRLTTYIKSA